MSYFASIVFYNKMKILYSNFFSSKFWTRNRPGDKMRDKYNLNLIPKGQEEAEFEDIVTAPAIPGISYGDNDEEYYEEMNMNKDIPGLGFSVDDSNKQNEEGSHPPKVPFSKPIPKHFESQWSERKSNPSVMPTQNDMNNIHENDDQDDFYDSRSHLNCTSFPSHPSQSFSGPPPHPSEMQNLTMDGSPWSESHPFHDDYQYNVSNDRFHPSLHNHPSDNYLPAIHPQSPSQSGNFMNEMHMPGNMHRREQEERFNQNRDEDLRRPHYEYRQGPNDWRRRDDYQWQQRGHHHEERWRRDLRDQQSDNRWEWRQNQDYHWQRPVHEEDNSGYHNNYVENDYRGKKRNWREGPGFKDQEQYDNNWNRNQPNESEVREFNRRY